MGNGKVKPDAPSDAMLSQLAVNASLLRSDLLKHILDAESHDRDLDDTCGYAKDISAEKYRKMYDREGVARRVVACMPEECWSLDPEVYETEDTDETEFEKAWDELLRKMNLYHYLHRIDELSGIGRFGILLLGLSDGGQLSDPVDGIDEQGEKTGDADHKLLFLRTFDESVVTVKATEKRQDNPRYGQPTLYTVSFQSEDAEPGKTLSQEVHWSRVIHVADDRQMSEVFGTPRQEKVWNRLYDLRKILAGSGEMFWKGGFPGYSFEMDPDFAAAGGEMDLDSIREQVTDYQNGLQRWMGLTGITAKSLTPQVADPTGHVETELKAIAIAMSTPFRILFGSEQAQLASSQDARNWHGRVARRQNRYLTPMLIRPFVDRLIAFGVLPEPAEYDVRWPDLGSLTEGEQAEVAETRTKALAAYVKGNVIEIVPPRSYLMEIMGMDTDEIDAIEEEAAEYEAEVSVEEVQQPESAPEAQPAPGQEEA